MRLGIQNKGIQRLLDAIVEFLPSPADLPPVSGLAPDGASETRRLEAEQPLAALAFKIASDKHMGKLVYLRIYSGAISQGDVVLNPALKSELRIGRLIRMHANRQESIEAAGPGEIIAVAGIAKIRTGDTLCAPASPIILESISFPAPVLSVSIRPEDNRESEKAFEAVHRLIEEDPTFVVTTDAETSETILSGMGDCISTYSLTGSPRVQRCSTDSLKSRQKWPTSEGQETQTHGGHTRVCFPSSRCRRVKASLVNEVAAHPKRIYSIS